MGSVRSVALVVAVVGLGLSGCGGDDPADPAQPSPSPDVPVGQPAPTAGPTGGTGAQGGGDRGSTCDLLTIAEVEEHVDFAAEAYPVFDGADCSWALAGGQLVVSEGWVDLVLRDYGGACVGVISSGEQVSGLGDAAYWNWRGPAGSLTACAGPDGTAVALDISRSGDTTDEAANRAAAEALMALVLGRL